MLGEDFAARARTRARALAGEFGAARRRASTFFPDAAAHAERFGEALKKLIALEVAPGRLVPWLPVGFGLGVILYFAADREPALWAAAAAAAGGIVFAVVAPQRAAALIFALAFAS